MRSISSAISSGVGAFTVTTLKPRCSSFLWRSFSALDRDPVGVFSSIESRPAAEHINPHVGLTSGHPCDLGLHALATTAFRTIHVAGARDGQATVLHVVKAGDNGRLIAPFGNGVDDASFHAPNVAQITTP